MAEAGKQRYEKPVLRIIELAAEETLSVGCKLKAMGGPATCAVGSPCIGDGS